MIKANAQALAAWFEGKDLFLPPPWNCPWSLIVHTEQLTSNSVLLTQGRSLSSKFFIVLPIWSDIIIVNRILIKIDIDFIFEVSSDLLRNLFFIFELNENITIIINNNIVIGFIGSWKIFMIVSKILDDV